MSFRITDDQPAMDDRDLPTQSPAFGDGRDCLPFPTEAWRSMLTPITPAAGRGDRATAPQGRHGRSVHPAEAALAEVERHFARTVISINEVLDGERSDDRGTHDWRPRAA